MSKVVTIPTSQSPFVVMVNGAKYVFPAGSVQEVPDEVAIVIEAYSRETPAKPVDAPFDCCEGGGVTGGSVQTDWNQKDETEPDFLKNKPFGDVPMVFFEEQEIAFVDGECPIVVSACPNVGDDIAVLLNGVEYVGKAFDAYGMPGFGNHLPAGGDDTGEPFFVAFINDTMAVVLSVDTQETSARLKISGMGLNKIDEKYISTIKKFYISESEATTGGYLYNDAGCTSKTTGAELRQALANYPVILSLMNVYVFPVQFGNIMGSVPFVNIMTFNDELKTFYTAEYVPAS